MKFLSIKEELHKNHIKDKGRFTIDCNTIIFSTEEIEILEKWGHWFIALCNGHLSPFTEKQRRFIRIMKGEGEEEPFSPEEQAWYKYLGRKRWEEKHGDKPHYNYIPEKDGFYSREMIKQQKALMFKIIIEEHKK